MVFSGLRGKQAFLGSHEGFVEDYLLDAGHGWPPELVQPKLATAKGRLVWGQGLTHWPLGDLNENLDK